jgi:hypothetical protein
MKVRLANWAKNLGPSIQNTRLILNETTSGLVIPGDPIYNNPPVLSRSQEYHHELRTDDAILAAEFG